MHIRKRRGQAAPLGRAREGPGRRVGGKSDPWLHEAGQNSEGVSHALSGMSPTATRTHKWQSSPGNASGMPTRLAAKLRSTELSSLLSILDNCFSQAR